MSDVSWQNIHCLLSKNLTSTSYCNNNPNNILNKQSNLPLPGRFSFLLGLFLFFVFACPPIIIDKVPRFPKILLKYTFLDYVFVTRVESTSGWTKGTAVRMPQSMTTANYGKLE